MNLDHQYFRLHNGLRVVLHRDPRSPLVCINLAYAVGSRDEAPGEFGYAHLLEHLMFSGSQNIPRGAFDGYCERAGGYNNAFTSEDKTNYYMVLPSSHLELGLWLESDRFFGLRITDEGFEAQQSVVLEEKSQRIDNQPYGKVEEALASALFMGHAYGHTVIGLESDLRDATRDRLDAFYRRMYRPENAVLVIAGDIDLARTEYLVARYFDEPVGDVPRVPVPSGRLEAVHPRTMMTDEVPLEAAFVAFRICSEQDPDFPALDLTTDILGNGESSRLIRQMMYTTDLASQVNAYVEPRQDSGILMCYAIANPGRTAVELEAVMSAELEKLRKDGLTDDELTRVRNRISYTFYHSLTTMTSRAERLGHFALFYDDPGRIESIMDDYLAISGPAIRTAAEAYLGPEATAVIHVLPGTAEGDTSMEFETSESFSSTQHETSENPHGC